MRKLVRPLWLLLLGAAAAAGPVDGAARATQQVEEKGLTAKPADAFVLTRKLGDLDWRVRDAAMRELIALGKAAKEALRLARVSTDAEVRWRAAYALSRLEAIYEVPAEDPGRMLYASAAHARAQKGGADAARMLYEEVIRRAPESRWGKAARERLKAFAPEPKPVPAGDRQAELARLVRQLGSPNWAERQRASWRLAELGEAAKPALEQAAGSPDTEVAWRVKALLERLEREEAQAEGDGPHRRPRASIGMLARLFGEDEPGQQPTDIDDLVRTLSSARPQDVAHAREVLLNLGDDALPALVRGLETGSEVAGVEIMDLLHQITSLDLGFSPQRWQAWWRQYRQRGGD